MQRKAKQSGQPWRESALFYRSVWLDHAGISALKPGFMKVRRKSAGMTGML